MGFLLLVVLIVSTQLRTETLKVDTGAKDSSVVRCQLERFAGSCLSVWETEKGRNGMCFHYPRKSQYLDFHCMSAFQEIICSMFYNSSSLKTVSPEMIIHNQSVISYCEELLYFNCRFSLVKCKLRLLPRNPWSGWDSSPSGVRRACWLSDTWTGNEVALCAPAGCKQKLSSWIQHLASLWRCRHQ